jgi:NitT/TauT family transport system substrate-binding protein
MRFRPLIVGCLALVMLGGCGRKQPAAAEAGVPREGAPFKITVQLDWVPEPEHGGFFQAQARGFFKEEGLDVLLLSGGANARATQKVATGEADLAQGESTGTLLAIAQGLPVTQIGAVFQNDPSVLMLHPENPVNRFEDLQGKTVIARLEWAFIPYLEKKYGIKVNLTPQNFSTAPFVANRDAIQQGYYIAEPFFIKKAGGETPKYLYTWDAGFEPYDVIIANRAWAQRNPEHVRAFLRAYIRGWRDYLEGDPKPAHDLMKAANKGNTDEFLAFSRQMIIGEKLVVGRKNGGPGQIGRITRERFETQISQLEDLGILAKGKVTVDQAMTTDYLPAP